MIRVKRPPKPQVLVGPESAGGRETARATALYSDEANAEAKFAYSAYSHQTIKDALNEAFHEKCAYCESSYKQVHPVDVEHYRPKGGFVVEGALHKPGYYWLAADWDNLLPSCIDCNRRRTQRFDPDERRASGKENLFPIASETRRAKRPGDEKRERRLLLHPTLDRPERHLEFLEDGLVRARVDRRGVPSLKGEASIETYGLLRRGLVQARRDDAVELLARMETIRDLLLEFQDTGSARLRETLRREVARLKADRRPERPYSAMARALIDPFLESVTP